MGLLQTGLERRAARAIERQLAYQERKAAKVKGREQRVIARMQAHSAEVRARLEAIRPIAPDAAVLEVGCGAHGLIFYFGTSNGVGVDPLADHYAKMFPAWHGRARTVTAYGEELPFADASFDVVLCDNVVDHAENPRRVLEEIVRVLAPGALLFFEVNVHHPVYHAAATLHAGWRALGIPFEITPFADHTVHLTPTAAQRLFEGLPLELVEQRNTVEDVKRAADATPIRHPGDRVKRWFYKNAAYEVIARRI